MSSMSMTYKDKKRKTDHHELYEWLTACHRKIVEMQNENRWEKMKTVHFALENRSFYPSTTFLWHAVSYSYNVMVSFAFFLTYSEVFVGCQEGKMQGCHCQRQEAEVSGYWFFNSCPYQRRPESLFQTRTPLLFQNFWIRVRQFFKFDNPTPVQTPATIIDPTVIYTWLYLRYNRTDSCHNRNGKMTPDPDPVYHKFLTPCPKEKRRILLESTPVLQIRSHLWTISEKIFAYPYPILIRKVLKFSIQYPAISKCDIGKIWNKQAAVIGPTTDFHFWKLIHPSPVPWH